MTTDTTNIVRNKQGRMVGKIEDRMFTKEVYSHLHMLRKPTAWAIDCDIFDRMIKPLCYSIRIIDKDTGHQYTVDVNTFQVNKQKINRKFGDQYYLELVHWRVQ